MIPDEILSFLATSEPMKANEIAKAIAKPGPSVRRSLAELMRAGKVTRTGKRGQWRYVVAHDTNLVVAQKPEKLRHKVYAMPPVLEEKQVSTRIVKQPVYHVVERTELLEKRVEVPVERIIEREKVVEKPVLKVVSAGFQAGETTPEQLRASERYYKPIVSAVRDEKMAKRKGKLPRWANG